MTIAPSALMSPTIQIWSFRIFLKFHYSLQMFCSSPWEIRSTSHTYVTSPAQIGPRLLKGQDRNLILRRVQDHVMSSFISLLMDA
jgi:hypothetical protein